MKQWEKVLQRSSAPLDGTAPPPSFTAPSLPPSLHALIFSLALFSLRLLILCRRKIRIAREHNEDYQIDIGDNLFLPSLLHGLSLHFPLLSACATHSLFVVNLCFHPLPFKSLTPSGYVREPRERERMGGGECTDKQTDLHKSGKDRCSWDERFWSLSLRCHWFSITCMHTQP